MRYCSGAFAGVSTGVLLAVAGQLAWVGQSSGQTVINRKPERMDQRPGIPARRTSAPGGGHGGGNTYNLLTQVNINGAGMNILGDAANEPTIVVDPTAPNRMAIGWRQFDTVTSNFRQAGRAWSDDGGRTWHNPGVLTPGTFRSDPVMDSTAEGRFYYQDIGDPNTFENDFFISDNHGMAWMGPIFAYAGDKNWFTIDRTSGPGHGFIYATWQTCCGAYSSTTFTRSTNGGMSFMTPMAIPGPPIFGTMTVGPDGELYIAGISGSSFRVDKSTNAQNGAMTPSFTTATVNLGGSFGLPGSFNDPNPDGLEGVVWVDVDRSNGPRRGWVYLLSTVHTTSSDPEDIMFSRSTNGGVTWSTPVRVNNDTQGANHYQWFGTMSVAPSGRIDVVWNDTRESLAYNLARLYYAWSDDGGVTWQGNTPQTNQWSSTIGWPQQNKIGDYYHMRSDDVGAFLAFAATFNNEQDVYFLRLGDYDCNQNGVPDATDLMNGTLHDCNGNGIPDECEIAAGVPVPCFHPCYANCDSSTTVPFLNVNDFVCFQNRFAAGDSYANCDGSTNPPILNVNDFICFQNLFAAGCSAP